MGQFELSSCIYARNSRNCDHHRSHRPFILKFCDRPIPYLFGGMELVQNTPISNSRITLAGDLANWSPSRHWSCQYCWRRIGCFDVRTSGTNSYLRCLRAFRSDCFSSSWRRRYSDWCCSRVSSATDLDRSFVPDDIYVVAPAVFVWFAVTVLRGKRQYFAWGTLWSAIVVLGMT